MLITKYFVPFKASKMLIVVLIYALISSFYLQRELLGQAWMKSGKEKKAPNVLLFSKRFNQVIIVD